jgi:hypothetical protein
MNASGVSPERWETTAVLPAAHQLDGVDARRAGSVPGMAAPGRSWPLTVVTSPMVRRGSMLASMPRDPNPRSIEQLERDDEVDGPAGRRQEHRLLVQLSRRSLLSAADHIADSRALLARIGAKFPGRRQD